MTSFLKQVSNSMDSPPGIRAVIAAQEKMGKTTMLASTPKPLLVPLEEGYAGIMVDKIPKVESFENLMGFLDEFIAARGAGYKSLCFDGAVGIERLIHDYTIRCDPSSKGNRMASMESTHGGYGKAYNVALNHFEAFLSKCDVLSRNGINIFIASHVFASRIQDPTSGEYDAWDLLLHSPKNNKTYGKREFLTQWADFIGFLHCKSAVSKNENMRMAVSLSNDRVMGVSRVPQYVAGNRYGVEGEFVVKKEQSWNYIAHQIQQATNGRLNYMA